MFRAETAFSSFSVDDIERARGFYGGLLGLAVSVDGMGILHIRLPGGAEAIAYPKPDHEPARFTVLNFVVPDIDAAVDGLNAAGIATKIYGDGDDAPPTDDRGIVRAGGPQIAWFRDTAGNVLSVLSA